MGRKPENSRSGRHEELTGLLRSREVWTTADLASALEVSHRTLMRDLEFLRERGVPVEGERGRGGGVRLHRNWGIGRLTLDYRETLDLLLSLAVMEKLDSPLMLGTVKSIRNKIVLSFPDAERKRVMSLRSRIWIGALASGPVKQGYRPPPPGCLDAIHESFFSLKKLAIRYVDGKVAKTSREIEPQFLFLNWPVWYLLAWDSLREDVRFFRVDRIVSANVLPDNFRIRETAQFEKIIDAVGRAL